MLELMALPRSGPFLHVHHREDEWYYVLSGEFTFRAGGEEFNLSTGGSIWLPRGIPHVWANTATTEGKLILMCEPGGFEKFFDEIGNLPMSKKSPDTMKELMAKYGMEMLGPPIFASSWMQQQISQRSLEQRWPFLSTLPTSHVEQRQYVHELQQTSCVFRSSRRFLSSSPVSNRLIRRDC